MNDRGSFRQGGHKPALVDFRRWGTGESTDEILDSTILENIDQIQEDHINK